jgi:hypothetical protein
MDLFSDTHGLETVPDDADPTTPPRAPGAGLSGGVVDMFGADMFGEQQAGYEGTRKKVVVSSAEGGKVKQTVSAKKEGGKDQHQLLFVDRGFLESHCGCRISGGNGIEKFCAEALVGDEPCRFKTHQSYPKSTDLRSPAWYIVVQAKGRGGAVGLCEKWVLADSVTDPSLKRTLDGDFRSTSQWSTLFEELALSSVVGDNVVGEGATHRNDIASRIKEVCTPFKRRQLRLSEADSPLSKTSAEEMSTDSWVQTGTGYEGRAVPTMEQPDLDTLKSPSSTAGTSINLRKAMGVLQGNMSSLESFLQEQQKDLQTSIPSALSTPHSTDALDMQMVLVQNMALTPLLEA